MTTGVDGEPAVGAGGPAGRQDPLRLSRERHHLLGGRPEARGRERVRVLGLVLALRRLPGDDDELPLALVVAQAQLADRPLGIARLLRRRLQALRRGTEALGLEQLAHPDHQSLDVKLLAVQDDRLAAAAGSQEELAPPGRADRADADAVDRVEVYASSHCCESTVLHHPRRRQPGPPGPGFGPVAWGKASHVLRNETDQLRRSTCLRPLESTSA